MKKVQMLQEILKKLEDRACIRHDLHNRAVVAVDLDDITRVLTHRITKEVNRMDRAKRNKKLVKDLVSGEMITEQEYERRKCEALGAPW